VLGYNGNFTIHNQRIFYGDPIKENGMCVVEGTRVIIQKFEKFCLQPEELRLVKRLRCR